MGSVLFVIHLTVAILLVALILLQRNSGNALSGLGGGNGADSFLSARGKGNLLTKTTAILATIFFITSMALALYYKGETRANESITDVAPLTQTAPQVPSVPDAMEENAPAPVAESAPAAESPASETSVAEEAPQEAAPAEPAAAEAASEPAAE